jgi:uncharacterized membrane protein HdeD (DUF308 family)
VWPFHLDQGLGLTIAVVIGVLALISGVIDTIKKRFRTAKQHVNRAELVMGYDRSG